MIKCIEQEIVPAVWKEDKNLGIAFSAVTVKDLYAVAEAAIAGNT